MKQRRGVVTYLCFTFSLIWRPVPIGSIRDLPAESCEEIKASEGQEAVSGNYWLDRHSTGEPTLIHCYLNMKGQ